MTGSAASTKDANADVRGTCTGGPRMHHWIVRGTVARRFAAVAVAVIGLTSCSSSAHPTTYLGVSNGVVVLLTAARVTGHFSGQVLMQEQGEAVIQPAVAKGELHRSHLRLELNGIGSTWSWKGMAWRDST